jgi:superfamily II DNA/RNA helicase
MKNLIFNFKISNITKRINLLNFQKLGFSRVHENSINKKVQRDFNRNIHENNNLPSQSVLSKSNYLDDTQIQNININSQQEEYELPSLSDKYPEYDPSVDFLDRVRKNNPIIDKTLKQEENSLSFKEFNFLPEIYHVLDSLKFYAPTSIQSVAIPKIMTKKHVFFTSQTGTGKTLSYILPLIHELKMQEKTLNRRLTMTKRPRALIIVPSRELAQQVEEVIKLFVYDVPLVVESFFVGKNYSTEREAAKRGLDILITTPERFKNHWSKNNIYTSRLTNVVVDELDTLLDSGYDEFLKTFSEMMLKKNNEDEEDEDLHSPKIKQPTINLNNNPEKTMPMDKPNLRQIVYVSTTLTPPVENYLNEMFAHRTDFVKIIDKSTNHNLSNIKHEFMHVTDYNKFPTLLKILADNIRIIKENMSIIIFVNNVSCARKVELFLSENNYSTACLHGDIPPIRRKNELAKFKARRAKILVCTDLIARGLDFPFVYLVINFDFPKTVSDYLHRAGRTGRQGRKGIVLSFYRNFNLNVIEKIKKAHQLNLPLEVQNSMYSLRKALPNDKNLKPEGRSRKVSQGIREKIIKRNELSPKGEEGVIDRLKKRKEAFEKFKIKTQKTRNEIIQKMNERNRRKTHHKNRMDNMKIKLRKKIYK